MGYYIDLAGITIDQYKKKLQKAYLPPSRVILRERSEERFAHFKKKGIKNLQELKKFLSRKENTEELSGLECFGGDYLKILLREINSTLPNPNKIADFPGISAVTASKLESIGIKNTLKLYDRVLTPESRKELANQTEISEEEIMELTRLTDISRIKWVGTTFARMLYDLGIDSIKKATAADAVDLHARINQLNKEKDIYRGHIALNDIRIFIEAAGEVPQDIEY